MATLDINPRYRDYLARHGLADAARLQALPATIICGHTHRHVLRGTLGPDGDAIPVIIKRQHRVSWREKIANAWAGFGWASNCRREARMLERLHTAGVPAPEWIAAGQDDQAQAFLILRAVPEARDLAGFLRGPLGQRPPLRRRLARLLGEAIAHMHDAGFSHPDLYAKHVLVQPAGTTFHFLDWQRARQRLEVAWPCRWRDLAALDASLADELVSPRDRLACLRAYWKATLPMRAPPAFRRSAMTAIRQHSGRLLGLRRIREQRQVTRPIGSQPLIWLDGEGLCVTPEFRALYPSRMPDWLTAPAEQDHPVTLPGPARAMLVRRSTDELGRWLWTRLRRQPLHSPEWQQVAMLFRLQRYGVATPRLLAFGQRHPIPWRTDSFLLTDVPPGRDLVDWLGEQAGRSLWTAERKRRWQVIRTAGRLVRRVHDASCRGLSRAHQLGINAEHDVMLEDVTGMAMRRGLSRRGMVRDLRRLHASMPAGPCSRTDRLRFMLAYCGATRVTQAVRDLLAQIGMRPALPREARPAA